MNQTLIKILKAIFRPDRTQKKSQKEKINHSIDKFQYYLKEFDRNMDQLRTGLDQATGKGETRDYSGMMGKPEDKDYSTLLGKRDIKFF